MYESGLQKRSCCYKTAGLEGGANPRCSCGAVMKKPYRSPALTKIADGSVPDVLKGREE